MEPRYFVFSELSEKCWWSGYTDWEWLFGWPVNRQEFCEFRARCGLLWCYDWVSIPMVYTQVLSWSLWGPKSLAWSLADDANIVFFCLSDTAYYTKLAWNHLILVVLNDVNRYDFFSFSPSKVVTLATYVFFIFCLIGRQKLDVHDPLYSFPTKYPSNRLLITDQWSVRIFI